MNLPIHYEKHVPPDGEMDNSPVLFLIPGFGVGTFHYDRQFQPLTDGGFVVYSMDLLGQGRSWPTTTEDGLCYSIELWRDQIIFFVDTVIQKPVHLAGNSLGGYLCVCAGSSRPDLVKSVCLLNSAPFWGFASPQSRQFPFSLWNGTLPVPEGILSFGSLYFDLMRNRETVKSMLSGVYKSKNAFDDNLVEKIIESASPPGVAGQEAFSSILFSPKLDQSFDSMLRELARYRVPTLLIYGQNDPWIVPYWGQRAVRAMDGDAVYIALDGAGHCPHHECGDTVNKIINSWVGFIERADMTQIQFNELRQFMFDVEGVYVEPLTQERVKVSVLDGSPVTFTDKILQFLDSVQSNFLSSRDRDF